MKNRSRRLASLLTSALARIEPCEPRQLLSTYVVNTLSDATNPGAGLVTLRQAVADANLHSGADTITFDPKVFAPGSLHTITLVQGQIQFTDTSGKTTVNGPGSGVVAVDGNGQSRVFSVFQTVSISGLTITGGDVQGQSADDTAQGGGIYNLGTLSLTDSTISGNSAIGFSNRGYDYHQGGSAQGGGIYSAGPMTINGCTISGNYAAGGTAGDFRELYGNTANGGDGSGGGVYAGTSLTITNSTLTGNTASAGNSGYFGGTAGVVTGGGIFAGGSVTLTGSDITHNFADGGVSAYSDSAGGDGGGLYAGSSATLLDDHVDDNSLDGTAGSAVSTSFGGGIFAAANLSIQQSTVQGNTVTAHVENGVSDKQEGGIVFGGGIAATGQTQIGSSTISGNTALGATGQRAYNIYEPNDGGDGRGGGLFISGICTVTNSTIALNAATGGTGGDGHGGNPRGPGGAGGNGAGGAVYSTGSFTAADSTITGNTANVGQGGAPYNSNYPAGPNGTATAGGINIVSGNTTFTNSIVSANMSAGVFSDIVGVASASSEFNLIGVGGGLTNSVNGNHVGVTNPDLSPLGEYGGPTLTMVPIAGSPAIDAGSNALLPLVAIDDQRGLARIFNSTVDIGAVEVQPKIQPLGGKIIGTAGSFNNHGTTIANVFDQNLSTYFDAPLASGAYVGLDLGTSQVVSQISYSPRIGWASRMVGGKFQASNSVNFSAAVVTLYTITAKPAAGVMTTVSISNKTPYRYIRYVGPTNSYCDIAEMQLFGPATAPTEFPGAIIGTAGSYRNHGDTISKAFDQNFSTFFDGPNASGDWVGEAFAAPVVVTQVKFAARAGYASRMVGGMIQASNTADFSSGVVTLRTISYPPPSGSLRTVTLSNTTGYRYYRYIGPTNSYCDIAELEFLG
jgi:hypothetical protein